MYERRPLDCQLYPLALMWNEAYNEVQLGWDATCPFMQEQLPDSVRARITSYNVCYTKLLRQGLPKVRRRVVSDFGEINDVAVFLGAVADDGGR